MGAGSLPVPVDTENQYTEQHIPLRHEFINLNERDPFGCTPLHIALLQCHPKIVQMLVQAHASMNKRCEGAPPLCIAAQAGAHQSRLENALLCIRILIEHGSVPYERDDQGRTAFHWAAAYGLTPLMGPLMTAAEELRSKLEEEEGNGDDPVPPSLIEFLDKQGNSAAHLAARYGYPAALKAALEAPRSSGGGAGHTVNQRNKAKMNVLHMAALGGCLECASLALQASPQAASSKTRQGFTASDIALRRGHMSIVDLLDGTGSVRAAPMKKPQTIIYAPPECLNHHTAPEPIHRASDLPPENVNRLHVLTHPEHGILRTTDMQQMQLEWDELSKKAAIGDVLRVHDWTYVQRIKQVCDRIPDDPSILGQLDGDTAISHGTWDAALAAAGAVCSAVDALMEGKARNAFCAIRPPGHHAGPNGVVTSARDPNGSHGFCIFSNAAIGAAYAMNVYRNHGIKKVAILDFDVHHGNGTEACVINAIPSVQREQFMTPWSQGVQVFQVYKPWRDVDDPENIFFASVQGFGPKLPGMDAFVYPGSGTTRDNRTTSGEPLAVEIVAAPLQPNTPIEEDPDKEFETKEDEENVPTEAPRVIDVGIPGFGPRASLWRRAWRDKILPALVKFDPDVIFISAGFDAHKKDEINFSYIGITERDYEWLTEQIVAVANRCCNGRIVSALEGGYRIHGGIISAFARSVAAHVRCLAERHSQQWDPEDALWERNHEKELKAEAEAKKLAAYEAERAAREAVMAAAVAAHEASAVDDMKPSAIVHTPITAAEEKEDEDAGNRKRRRTAVDYVALNKRLEEEARAKEQANGQ